MKSETQIQPRAMRAVGAAAYCGVSRSTFLKLVADGDAPKPGRLGPGVVIWDRNDLDCWIESRKAVQS